VEVIAASVIYDFVVAGICPSPEPDPSSPAHRRSEAVMRVLVLVGLLAFHTRPVVARRRAVAPYTDESL
jgi:hypothetical protein